MYFTFLVDYDDLQDDHDENEDEDEDEHFSRVEQTLALPKKTFSTRMFAMANE